MTCIIHFHADPAKACKASNAVYSVRQSCKKIKDQHSLGMIQHVDHTLKVVSALRFGWEYKNTGEFLYEMSQCIPVVKNNDFLARFTQETNIYLSKDWRILRNTVQTSFWTYAHDNRPKNINLWCTELFLQNGRERKNMNKLREWSGPNEFGIFINLFFLIILELCFYFIQSRQYSSWFTFLDQMFSFLVILNVRQLGFYIT